MWRVSPGPKSNRVKRVVEEPMTQAQPRRVNRSNHLGLRFVNRFNELVSDPVVENYRRQVDRACFSRVLPTPTTAPSLVAYSPELTAQLGLTTEQVATEEFVRVFSGNLVTADMDPIATCYGGHQFGSWAGQLGDGRAITLGEVEAKDGSLQTLQLKGAGPTPYSRRGDGRAVLRSSVREFLCSEAMWHLGVPTTRALSLCLTGERVVRDMFYDGNPNEELGAVVCRVAPSFTRFGNFEIFAARGDLETLRLLVEWTIRNDFSDVANYGQGPLEGTAIVEWFREVLERTVSLIVDWARIGFVHGVMNTDNLSVLGLTIDYGPYGWLEIYDPDWTPNTTDAQTRRYRFGTQDRVAHWNLYRFANAIAPLLDESCRELLQESLDAFPDLYRAGFNAMMARRLGFVGFDGDRDERLFNDLFEVLAMAETDWTIFFRSLAEVDPAAAATSSDAEVLAPVARAYYNYSDAGLSELLPPQTAMANWIRRWVERLGADDASPEHRAENRVEQMRATNPKYVLRNWMVQQAIDDAERGNYDRIEELTDLVRKPYDDQPAFHDRFFVRQPEWARERAGCSMLSCSS